MAKLIFVNLPVADLPRAKAFYEAIGARNDQARFGAGGGGRGKRRDERGEPAAVEDGSNEEYQLQANKRCHLVHILRRWLWRSWYRRN